MTYEARHGGRGSATGGAAWILPVLGGGVLTLAWGAYTIFVVTEIFTLPWPTYPG